MGTDTEPQQGHSDVAEDAMIVRSFAAEMTAGDGRTVDVRIIPYGETAVANDGFGFVARGVPYTEEWMPGVFNHQMNAANRVLANFEHEQGIRGIVGRGSAFREAADGFHGSFKLHDDPDGDKALMLVKEGVLTGVSLEAQPRRDGSRLVNGIVQRFKANLKGIALCREPAYANAKVLAVREAIPFAEELLPFEIDPELIERCRRLGVKLPQRYQAHPDTDTPALSGTP